MYMKISAVLSANLMYFAFEKKNTFTFVNVIVYIDFLWGGAKILLRNVQRIRLKLYTTWEVTVMCIFYIAGFVSSTKMTN